MASCLLSTSRACTSRYLVMRSSLSDRVSRWIQLWLLFSSHAEWSSFLQSMSHAVFTLWAVTGRSGCLIIIPPAFIFPAASSFSFCRPAVEYRALPEDFKHQLSRRTGGNLTWHDGRGQKTAGGRTVKLLQQPGTEALQVLNIYMTSTCRTAHGWYPPVFLHSPRSWRCLFLLNIALNRTQHQTEVIFAKKSLHMHISLVEIAITEWQCWYWSYDWCNILCCPALTIVCNIAHWQFSSWVANVVSSVLELSVIWAHHTLFHVMLKSWKIICCCWVLIVWLLTISKPALLLHFYTEKSEREKS